MPPDNLSWEGLLRKRELPSRGGGLGDDVQLRDSELWLLIDVLACCILFFCGRRPRSACKSFSSALGEVAVLQPPSEDCSTLIS